MESAWATPEQVRALPSSGLNPGCARTTRTDRGTRASQSTSRLDEARSVLIEDAIGKSRLVLSRAKTINSRKEP
jgi:hypothetical protein